MFMALDRILWMFKSPTAYGWYYFFLHYGKLNQIYKIHQQIQHRTSTWIKESSGGKKLRITLLDLLNYFSSILEISNVKETPVEFLKAVWACPQPYWAKYTHPGYSISMQSHKCGWPLSSWTYMGKSILLVPSKHRGEAKLQICPYSTSALDGVTGQSQGQPIYPREPHGDIVK
jgi:hypothetical protein